MKSSATNVLIALGLIAIGIAAAGIYPGETDDAPGAAQDIASVFWICTVHRVSQSICSLVSTSLPRVFLIWSLPV